MNISMVKAQVTPEQVGWFGLFLAYERDQADFQKIGLGEVQNVKVTLLRNRRHHNLYWSVMEFIFQNHNSERLGFSFYSKEQVSKYLLIRTLHIASWMIMPDGTRIPEAESISFSKKDQDAFQKYWDEAVPIIEEVMGMPMKEIEAGIRGY
jgi:hypothetical protein